MISVVLVEPQSPGNIGSVARAMQNFGCKNLVIVNPKCDYLANEALWRAKHALNVLKKAVVVKSFQQLKKFDTLIAATAAVGASSNVARIPLTPEQLSEKYRELSSSNAALVFGRDSTGLTNSEILKCDFIISIPASAKYRSLNLSHAVAVVLYELFKRSRQKKIASRFTPASRNEKDIIMKHVEAMLGSMRFHFSSQRITQRKIWRRLIGKAMLSRREAFAVIGFLKKAQK
ncbi:RNA methyltransferase [Candidatus Woesearchaeota archaeon]|nr:RNA methyltransferase [Candidatus Woesearchaeota archaeon]